MAVSNTELKPSLFLVNKTKTVESSSKYFNESKMTNLLV